MTIKDLATVIDNLGSEGRTKVLIMSEKFKQSKMKEHRRSRRDELCRRLCRCRQRFDGVDERLDKVESD